MRTTREAPGDAARERETDDRPVVCMRGVHKAFGTKEILRGLDLEVQAGRTLAIMGGSGTGKSVALRHVIGLMEPDAGTTWRPWVPRASRSCASAWATCSRRAPWWDG